MKLVPSRVISIGLALTGALALNMVPAANCYGRGVVLSSWEPGSEIPGQEYIYNQSTGMSVQQPVTYRDKWYPYPLDGSQPEPFETRTSLDIPPRAALQMAPAR